MEQKIKIDVIVPVYNVEKYLAQCLDSLVKQTIPIRIIIVNDGATDGSKEIAQTYVETYKDMILYVEQENAGLSAARNTGLAHVQAPFVAFMDSDDWVSEDYYEQLLITLAENDADIVCSDITYAYENGKMKKKPAHNLPATINENYISNTDPNYHSYILSIFPMAQNKLWKSELIKDSFTFLVGKQYEDLDFFYRIYPSTTKIAFTNKGVFYYRQRAGSIVKTADIRILEIMDVFNNIFAYYEENDLLTKYYEEIAYLLIRNCLVASAKRLAYSRKRMFIRNNLSILFTYTLDMIPNWKQNKYLRPFSLRHLFIRSYAKNTIELHTFFLLCISLFLKK